MEVSGRRSLQFALTSRAASRTHTPIAVSVTRLLLLEQHAALRSVNCGRVGAHGASGAGEEPGSERGDHGYFQIVWRHEIAFRALGAHAPAKAWDCVRVSGARRVHREIFRGRSRSSS